MATNTEQIRDAITRAEDRDREREARREQLRSDAQAAFGRDGQRPPEPIEGAPKTSLIHSQQDRERVDREAVAYRERHDRRTEATPTGPRPLKGN